MLTAAHCVARWTQQPASIGVGLGSRLTTVYDAGRIPADHILLHPGFLTGRPKVNEAGQPTGEPEVRWQNDLAIVRLSRPLPLHRPEVAAPACLDGEPVADRQLMYVLGYGLTELLVQMDAGDFQEPVAYGDRLKRLPVIQRRPASLADYRREYGQMLLVGPYPAQWRGGVGYGDSGGPLQRDRQGESGSRVGTDLRTGRCY